MGDGRERAKERAGRRAARLVEDGMKVGLGTGSTVRHLLSALGERRPRATFVATSEGTAEIARGLGLELTTPDEAGRLDLAVDGADEVDPRWNLIKGGGGAHAREKIVARMAQRFVVVVDASKLVERLGAFGVPLEVLPFAPGVVAERVREAGARRVSERAVRSDNGNALLDADFGPIGDPDALARALEAIPGLVEHGLFPGGWVERVIVGDADGVRELTERG